MNNTSLSKKFLTKTVLIWIIQIILSKLIKKSRQNASLKVGIL